VGRGRERGQATGRRTRTEQSSTRHNTTGQARRDTNTRSQAHTETARSPFGEAAWGKGKEREGKGRPPTRTAQREGQRYLHNATIVSWSDTSLSLAKFAFSSVFALSPLYLHLCEMTTHAS
jgi:hypothetical protein